MSPTPILGFVHINKTAGSTMKFVLRNSFGLRHCDTRTTYADGVFRERDLRIARVFYPGLRSISGHWLRHPTRHLPERVRCFTFLRDPLQRAASHFQQTGKGPWQRRRRWRRAGGRPDPTFEEFCADPEHRNLQTRRIVGSDDAEAARREIERHYWMLGLTEAFPDSLRLIAKLAPYPIDLRYQRLKVAKQNDVKKGLLADPATRRMLEDANAADLALYDWARTKHFPSLLADAGDLAGFEPREIHETTGRVERTVRYNRLIYRNLVRLLPPGKL